MIAQLCELILDRSPLNKALFCLSMLFPGLHIYGFLPLLYFNSNIIKATVNDDSTLDVSGSLTKSQKNFSSASSSSNNNASRSPRSPGQPRRREVTEEEAERSAVFSSPHMFPLELFFFTWSSSYKCLIGLWDISDCSKWLFYMVKHS